MVVYMNQYLLTLQTVFSGWKDSIMQYSLLIFIIFAVYVLIFYIIRFAISLRLTHTISYIMTILLMVIGIYVYTTTVKEVHIIDVVRFMFESITIFGLLLLFIMVFRTFIRKLKT